MIKSCPVASSLSGRAVEAEPATFSATHADETVVPSGSPWSSVRARARDRHQAPAAAFLPRCWLVREGFGLRLLGFSPGGERLHVHTAGGLLHSDFRTPSLDYGDLMALTMVLTRDVREVERMYRLAVFNVLAHNRDDHARNFGYLMDGTGEWKVSPAYDLTFSSDLVESRAPR